MGTEDLGAVWKPAHLEILDTCLTHLTNILSTFLSRCACCIKDMSCAMLRFVLGHIGYLLTRWCCPPAARTSAQCLQVSHHYLLSKEELKSNEILSKWTRSMHTITS